MKSEMDAQRIIKIGAPKEKVQVCGDIKYDGLKTEISAEDKKLQNIFPGNKRIIVAGSTHPGEEKQVCEAFLKLQEVFKDILLVLVPRHLERIDEVIKIVKDANINYILRTNLPEQKNQKYDIIIGNTYGELSKMYAFADVVFVGGSLVPIGGHNVMEAIAYGKPVISGKHYFNFRRHIEGLKENNAIAIVETTTELQNELSRFLTNREETKEMGMRGKQVVLQNKGALQNCINIIRNSLE